MKRVLAALVLAASAREAVAEPGFSLAAGGGANVGTPFVEARAGRRFERAPHFELYVDYSFDRAISEFSFQTFGVGVHTYLLRFASRFELFHQAVAALAISGSGSFMNRDLGQRLLGPVLSQGVGVEAALDRCWAAALVVSAGDPVWLRSELAVKYTF